MSERLPASKVAETLGVSVVWVKAQANPHRPVTANGDQLRFTWAEVEYLRWLKARDGAADG